MDWMNLFDRMTLEEKIGQMLCSYVTDEEEIFHMAAKGILGGLYTYTKGSSLEEAIEWINRIQAASRYPLFIAEDFEEGIKRFGTWLPSFMGIGATGDCTYAYRAGKVAARELAALGYGLVGSPVVDVNTNPENPIINIRSFGSDPVLVSDMAMEYIKAVREEGLLATCKHFPGHGDSSFDSHRELPVLDHDIERLEAIELLPYNCAIKAGVDAIMTTHMALPAIEKNRGIPATLSQSVLTGLLRGKMGFNGLIVSDAMDMWAITNSFETEEWSALAINAGIDILIVSYPMKAYNAIIKAVRSGNISLSRIDESVKRILAYKQKVSGNIVYPVNPVSASSVVGCIEHKRIADEIACAGVTCQGNAVNLKQMIASEKSVLLITMTNNARKFEDGNFSYTRGMPGKETVVYSTEEEPGEGAFLDSGPAFSKLLGEKAGDMLRIIHFCQQDISYMVEEAKKADIIILNISVINQAYNKNSAKIPLREKELLALLLNLPSKKIVVSSGNPYAVRDLKGQDCTIYTYGLCEASINAAIKGLWGEIAFQGRLPAAF